MIRLLALLSLAAPAAAQGVAFDPRVAETCLAATDRSPDCSGKAADACMEATPGGFSTVVMAGCYAAEADYWDGRLNAAYQDLGQAHRATDARASGRTPAAPPLAPALRDMQRAWIAYRDAACAYERARWGLGTGREPAGTACAMHLTARQALSLEAHLGEIEAR